MKNRIVLIAFPEYEDGAPHRLPIRACFWRGPREKWYILDMERAHRIGRLLDGGAMIMASALGPGLIWMWAES